MTLARDSSPPVVFMYSGEGSQYFGMGRSLLDAEPVFRSTMERLDGQVVKTIGRSVIEYVYRERRDPTHAFSRTSMTHPALFMLQYAMTDLLRSKGIHPTLLIGASLGEYVAAAVGGVLPVEAGLQMVLSQALLLDAHCAPGAMMAILAPPRMYQDSPVLREHSQLAAVNGNSHFVISGGKDDMATIAHWLQQKQVVHEWLPVERAFHSTLIEPVKGPILDCLALLPFAAADVPIISCTLGGPLESADPAYFWRVLRDPIRVADTIRQVPLQAGTRWVDLGPSGTMASLAKMNLVGKPNQHLCPIITRFGQEITALATICAPQTP